uniref:hypothetical protein n=1 Tax=Lachnospira eligens TaxID=39485 RepID=UPI003FF0BC89
MSKRNITFIIMIITLLTLPLSACGKNKNNISTDNSQKLQSESGQEYDDGRDAHMIPAGESQTNGESQKTGEKKNVQENASDAQDNNINSELPPVSIVPESTAAASSDAADKDTSGTDNTSGTDSTSSENNKTENTKTDPIELPFVPAY